MDPVPVEELHIVITGGAQGIGAASAKLLAGQGARVMITDVLDDQGRAFAKELGSNAFYHPLDVTKPDEWCAALGAAEARFGKVNALFNNAGVLSFSSVVDCSLDDFKRVIEVNLIGAFLGIHFSAPLIKRAGGGTIVNTSSTAGLQGYAGLAAYTASKWGLRGLSKASALDLAVDKIRVVSLHPGPIRTPMTKDLTDEVVREQPMPRFGEPEEVARMVRFLFCEATFTTGSEFVIDGGAVTGQVLPLPEK